MCGGLRDVFKPLEMVFEGIGEVAEFAATTIWDYGTIPGQINTAGKMLETLETQKTPKFEIPDSMLPSGDLPELDMDIPEVITPEMQKAEKLKLDSEKRFKRMGTGFQETILTSPLGITGNESILSNTKLGS